MAARPLTEELEEEVLLRFPPQEPALLVRAALVCKRWRRLVSGPAFRRRFRELHRTPPTLGFFCNILEVDSTSFFVPAAAAAFRAPDAACLRRSSVLDARHGRVLLQCRGDAALTVWDPITDEQLALPFPDLQRSLFSWTAAVTCAARVPCNHLDCNRGPFLVVFLASAASGGVSICTYSSSSGATWSDLITVEQPVVDIVDFMPSVLVGNALYFGFPTLEILVEYDLESHNVSVIGLPGRYTSWRHFVLDGALGFAAVHELKLCIWRKAGSGCSWAQHRVIELDPLLPSPTDLLVGFADAAGVFFLRAELVLFMIDVNTKKVEKVYEGRSIYSVVPYTSFYTPGTILLGFCFCNIQSE
jgi:hypothetical protein